MNDTWSQPGREHLEHRMRSMRKWRLVINVAALILGIVLVVVGNVIVGLVIGGLAAARLVMFSRFAPERHARTRMHAEDRTWLRARARDELVVAARALGCRGEELREHFRSGRSIAEVATERSVDLAEVTSAIAADLRAKATDAERAGTLSHDGAQRVNDLAPRFADRLVHRRRGDLPR